MTTYRTTWSKGMNTRPDHNVNNSPNGVVAYGETVNIAEVWTALADGVNVRKNDKWARLQDSLFIQWVAVIHLGVVYGVLEHTNPTPEPTPTPAPMFPQSFIHIDPSGKKAEYTFVRVIE